MIPVTNFLAANLLAANLLAAGTSAAGVRWFPVVDVWTTVGVSVAVAVGVWAVRRRMGGVLHDTRRGMTAVRAVVVAALLMFLLGPHLTAESRGPRRRPAVVDLLDASRSMTFREDDGDRWTLALASLDRAQRIAGDAAGNVDVVPFGVRLKPPLEDVVDFEADAARGRGTPCPADERTNLARALQRVAVRYGIDAKPSDEDSAATKDATARLAGVVVVSDGRSEDLSDCERAAGRFAASGVPVHVYPVGTAVGGEGDSPVGDISIASVSIPAEVRPFAKVPVELFVRSFGLVGRSADVVIVEITGGDPIERSRTTVELTGGPQAVSLTIAAGDRPAKLAIAITPIDDVEELSTSNNRIEADLDIDTSNLRVLYVEGSALGSGMVRSIFGGGTAPPWMVQTLEANPGIECIMLRPGGAPGRFNNVQGVTRTLSVGGFPDSPEKLFAFDMILISNLDPSALTDPQWRMIVDWVTGRGGGLWWAGGDAGAAGRFAETPAAELVPWRSDTPIRRETGSAAGATLSVAAPQHPVWRLSDGDIQNRSMHRSIPAVETPVLSMTPKPMATVLARSDAASDDEPAEPNEPNGAAGRATMIAHAVGRGRVVTCGFPVGGVPGNAWTSRWGGEDLKAARKWVHNIVYWATEGGFIGRRRVVASADKRFYRGGDEMTFSIATFDEAARPVRDYRVWCSLMPPSLDDPSAASPVVWPAGRDRPSGETDRRVVWGEEFPAVWEDSRRAYEVRLPLPTRLEGDGHFFLEVTAYSGDDPGDGWSHGTIVDSTSIDVRLMNDPFELRNPLPNHELLTRLASLTGGRVLSSPDELADVYRDRPATPGVVTRRYRSLWDRPVWFLALIGLIGAEWIWRRWAGMA